MSAADPDPPSKSWAVFLSLGGLLVAALVIGLPYLDDFLGELATSPWGNFLGRFHPLALHLPIGMLVLVILMEFGKMFRVEKGSSTQGPIFLTAGSAVVALVFGLLLQHSRPGEYDEVLLDRHLWWGVVFTCLLIAAFVTKVWVDWAGGEGNFLYLLVLLACAVAMTMASHDGGSMTHGTKFLTEAAPPEVREWLDLGAEEKEEVVPPEQRDVFADLVMPIFEAKCNSCHGEEKQKGKLRMDSYAALLAGGKEGASIEPGSAFDSNIIFRIELPPDDEEVMPPEGKKPITEDELKVIKWWLDSGAPEKQLLAEAEVPEEVDAAIARLDGRAGDASGAPDSPAADEGEDEEEASPLPDL